MSVLSGSHKCGLLEFEKKRISSDSYTDLVPKNIDSIKSMYSEEFCELELGDCVIFNELLIHKSNYNNSDSCRTVSVWRVIANTNLSTTLLNSDEL
jgi:ectoine hydroxylase-related dioxygenase (phytanoyl-CoA dioxygenase family)